MIERPCDLCSASIINNTGRYPRACGTHHAYSIPRDAPCCWLRQNNEIKKLCVLSLQDIDPRKKYFEEIRPLLKRLGEEFSENHESVQVFYYSLSLLERRMVMDYAHPDLRRIFVDSIPVKDRIKQKESQSKSERECDLCDAKIKNLKGRYPRACGMDYCIALPPEHSDCWLNHNNTIKELCVKAMQNIDPRHSDIEVVKNLLKQLGSEFSPNTLRLAEFLKSLKPTERHILLQHVTPEFKQLIVRELATHDLATRKPLAPVRIPDNLPEALLKVLTDFKDKLERRYERLIKQKHERDTNYIRHEMNDAIGLCVFLAERGFTGWEGVGNRDVVGYLESQDKIITNSLKRFVRFTEKVRNPFRKQAFSNSRRKGSVLVETPRPRIVPPQMLEQFIKSLKTAVSGPEYLLAWFVCKLGLSAERAYSLNLAELSINDAGRGVVRPAMIWVALPKHIEELVLQMAEEVLPYWRRVSEGERKHYHLFHHRINSLTKFRVDILQRRSKELRLSALYAMMNNGHLDRVTLIYSTGVSTPTLSKLERLFSADVHRRLDPDFIKLRNVHITGEVDKNG